VHACIARRPTDAVPLGFYLVDHDTIAKVIGRPTYVRNNVGTQIALWEGRRDEVVESMKTDVVDFYRKVDLCDIITFKEAGIVPPKGYAPDPPRKISDDCWEDKSGRVYKISTLSNEFVCIKDPVEQDRVYTAEEFEVPVQDTPVDPTTLEVYDHMVNAFGADRYIAGLTAGFNLVAWLGGIERGMMECVTAPEVVRAYFRRIVTTQCLADKYYLKPGLAGAFIESDMSTTRGPMLSPAMWRDLFLPQIQRRIAALKQRNLQILMHSCGNTRMILNDLIEAGVQVYQSIQNIPEMWVGKLKKEFGDRLVLWGGIPVEELVLGTPASVRKAVRRALEEAAPGGGFILGPSHSVAHGTKYENFMAMLDEFDKLRFKFT
jgi:uroporphyrinogen-III decarboxylase